MPQSSRTMVTLAACRFQRAASGAAAGGKAKAADAAANRTQCLTGSFMRALCSILICRVPETAPDPEGTPVAAPIEVTAIPNRVGMRRPVSGGMRSDPERRTRSGAKRRPAYEKEYHCEAAGYHEPDPSNGSKTEADRRVGPRRSHQPLLHFG